MELNHVFAGPSSPTLVIFLHEGLGSIKQWKQYPSELCEELQVTGLIYDRAGYGKSPGSLENRKPNYLHLAAEELKAVVGAYQQEYENIFLYGHSDGGSIALIAAANLKDRKLKGVITEAAHVFVEEETIKGVKEERPPFAKGYFDGLKKYHSERYKEVFFAWNDIWLDPSFKDWNIFELLPKIKCPQLAIQGKDDQYGTLKQLEYISTKTIGQTTLFVPENCGHAPHKEQKEAVLEIVKPFIHSYLL